MIDVYIWIALWALVLIQLIISCTRIADRMAEDRINKMFEHFKKRKREKITMPRYIDADLLINAINDADIITDTAKFIRDFPTADVVEVVRCKDCIHYENGFCYNPNTYDDEKTRGNTIPNWFCADGERKCNDQNTDR